ncbi:MAG: FecR domain-containing protein [Cyclobacteriaceae bacterium]
MDSYQRLITKKLSGEIREEEETTLQEWLKASPRNQRLFNQLEKAWKSTYEVSVQGQEQTFEKIAARLNLDQKQSISITISQSGSFWQRGWKIAASLLLLLGAATLFVIYGEETKPPASTETVVAASIIKHNPRGKKSIITLPDGTHARLNAESYLEYPPDFSHNRQVKLVGEAFFDVVRDTLHPFIVTAGEVEVRVLGTSFNVQAFPFEEGMTVAVASGSVRVEKKNQEQEHQTSQLEPLEMVKVNHATGAFEKSNFDPKNCWLGKMGYWCFIRPRLRRLYTNWSGGTELILSSVGNAPSPTDLPAVIKTPAWNWYWRV